MMIITAPEYPFNTFSNSWVSFSNRLHTSNNSDTIRVKSYHMNVFYRLHCGKGKHRLWLACMSLNQSQSFWELFNQGCSDGDPAKYCQGKLSLHVGSHKVPVASLFMIVSLVKRFLAAGISTQESTASSMYIYNPYVYISPPLVNETVKCSIKSGLNTALTTITEWNESIQIDHPSYADEVLW